MEQLSTSFHLEPRGEEAVVVKGMTVAHAETVQVRMGHQLSIVHENGEIIVSGARAELLASIIKEEVLRAEIVATIKKCEQDITRDAKAIREAKGDDEHGATRSHTADTDLSSAHSISQANIRLRVKIMELEQMKANLRLLNEGGYEAICYCMDCGQEIPLGRLIAVPGTSVCRDCKETPSH